MKVLVIVNPHAKKNKKRPEIAAKLQKIFGPAADVRLSETLEAVDAAAREALAGGVEVLGICGGDGTIHHTLSRFAKIYGDQPLPRLLLLGGGTMNMVCHSVGVLGPSDGIAHRFKAASENPRLMQSVRRETLRVDDRLCFIFGLGLVSNFLNAYYEGGTTGPVKAAWVVQKGVRSVIQRTEFAQKLFAPWAGRLTVDGVQVPYSRYTACLIQTIENLGIGFKPMYRAFEKPGHFHVIGTQMNPVRLVNHLTYIFKGRPWNHPDTFDAVARRVEVTPEVSTLYTMDGDMYTSDRPFTVEIGPAVEIIKV